MFVYFYKEQKHFHFDRCQLYILSLINLFVNYFYWLRYSKQTVFKLLSNVTQLIAGDSHNRFVSEWNFYLKVVSRHLFTRSKGTSHELRMRR
jgi:hypothetical protein